MVRKRSYKQESDDSDDDSDYSPEQDESQPKQYSLRKRTRPSFFEEFDYDVDDSDLSPRRQGSDDDDFEIDEQAEGPYVGPYVSYSQPLLVTETPNNSQADNGLIDFEDMIRADIVINKNHANHHSSPSEIKQTTKETTKKRRGRPPKRKTNEIEEFDPLSHSILGPLADEYLVPEGDFAHILEPVTQVESGDVQNGNTDTVDDAVNFSESNPEVTADLEPTNGSLVELNQTSEFIESESQLAQSKGETESIEKCIPPEELPTDKSNTPCESTTETQDNCKTTELPETNVITKVSEVPLIELDEDKTDDVIILDDKPDVIVLDD